MRLLATALMDPATDSREGSDWLERAGILASVFEVASVQEDARFVPGDRLLVHHHAPCGRCEACLGGHATGCLDARPLRFMPPPPTLHAVLPAWSLQRGTTRLPQTISDGAALLAVALARVRRAWLRISRPVQGGLAVLGSGALARAAGLYAERHHPNVRRILLELPEVRVPFPERLGYHGALPFEGEAEARETVRELCDGAPKLVVVARMGVQAVEEALELVAPGGTILLLVPPESPMVSVDMGRLQRDEIHLLGSSSCTPDNLQEALRMVPDLDGRLETVVGREIPLDGIGGCLDASGALRPECGFVLARP